jgi:large-conductance mechanosensitive channel
MEDNTDNNLILTIAKPIIHPINTINSIKNKSVGITKELFKDFGDFLMQRDVLSLALATTIGFYINNFTKDIIETLVTPILKRIFVGSNYYDEFTYVIFGIELKIGKIIEIILRFISTLFIIYFIFKFLPKKFTLR